MQDIIQTLKKNNNILIKFLPLFSLIIPFLILYSLYPNTFEMTWKGRTFYLFFLWLVFLEIILNWERVQKSKINRLKSIRTIAFIIIFLLPTIYTVAATYCGLNSMIADLAEKNEVYLADWVPLSTEYLIFTVLFALTLLLAYGIEALSNYSISTIFLGIIGLIYIVDNLYPYGRFTPFQFLVPTTAKLAASVLNLMGYQTLWQGVSEGLPAFVAWDSQGRSSGVFAIGWPCSGVESLLIYTVTILLFLKRAVISWKRRIVYFVIGAVVTYFINILRIVTIFVISINNGDVTAFHNLYGQLYSITWIVSYLLIIIGIETLLEKAKIHKAARARYSLLRTNDAS